MKRIEALRNQFKTDDLKLTFDTGVLTRAEREAYEVPTQLYRIGKRIPCR
jgi:hypothetical protein